MQFRNEGCNGRRTQNLFEIKCFFNKMTTLTRQKDTDKIISNEISDRDLLNLCIANPSLSICKDDNFWRERLFRKYGRAEKSPEKSWKTFYLQIVYYTDKINNVDREMYYAAKGGHRDLVDFFIKKGAKDWNLGIYGATQGGHMDLINFFIDKGADINWGLETAARGGRRDLVDFFIQKGADNWVGGLYNAANAGHHDLVQFFQKKVLQ